MTQFIDTIGILSLGVGIGMVTKCYEKKDIKMSLLGILLALCGEVLLLRPLYL